MSLDNLLRETIREAVRDELRAALEELREELARDGGALDGEQDALRESRELMNAKEAADFIRMSYSEFRKIASIVPRHRISERKYVYRRSQLLEWVISGQGERI
jgi:hypothetical protein